MDTWGILILCYNYDLIHLQKYNGSTIRRRQQAIIICSKWDQTDTISITGTNLMIC